MEAALQQVRKEGLHEIRKRGTCRAGIGTIDTAHQVKKRWHAAANDTSVTIKSSKEDEHPAIGLDMKVS